MVCQSIEQVAAANILKHALCMRAYWYRDDNGSDRITSRDDGNDGGDSTGVAS